MVGLIDGAAFFGLPKFNPKDRKTSVLRDLEDESGQMFRRRILPDRTDRLTIFGQNREQRVRLGQNHAMVPMRVEPVAQDRFDLGKIAHHAVRIQRVGGKRDPNTGVMSMQSGAFAVVMKQPMPIAERKFPRNIKHRSPNPRSTPVLMVF